MDGFADFNSVLQVSYIINFYSADLRLDVASETEVNDLWGQSHNFIMKISRHSFRNVVHILIQILNSAYR